MKFLFQLCLLAVFCSQLSAVVVFDHTTGGTFPGSNAESTTPNTRFAKPFTVSQQVTLTSFQIWAQRIFGGNGSFTMEIRNDSGGNPGTLLGSGTASAGDSSSNITVNFASGPTLNLSTTYWAVWYANSGAHVFWLHSHTTTEGSRKSTNGGSSWSATAGNEARRLALIVNGNPSGSVVTSINRSSSSPTNSASVSFTVSFDVSVSGVATGNFTVSTTGGITGASVTGVSGSGSSRTVTVSTGSGNGTVRLDMANSTGVTPNVTNLPFTSGQSYDIDKTAPTVTGITRSGSSPTNSASVSFSVQFSESVTGVDTGDFTVTTTGTISGTSVTGVSGSGTSRTVTVNTGSGDGTIRLDVPAAATILDNAGNDLTVAFTSGQTYTIDKTAPTVSSITRAAANPTNASSVTFTVTFSESVSGVSTGNFSVDATGPSGASISGISGTGATRTVTVNTGTGDGTLSIDLLNNLSNISDNAGNTMSSAFVSGEAYTVDKTAPGVSIGAPSVGSTSTGPVTYTITYTGADTVTLAGGNVTLNTTGTATGSVAVSGSGNATRTVTISSITGDGTIGISIAANTASDAAGNQAGAAGPSTTFTVSGMPGISIGAPSAILVSGGPVDFVVTYTNATAVTLAPGDVTLNTTGTVAGSVAVSGTGLTTRTVTVSGITGDGSFTISIAANTASNTAGNAPAAGPSGGVDVDNTAPGLTPAGTVTVSQGTTSAGAAVGTVSDNLTAAGNLGVAATTVPTGLVVNNITNTGGTVTADIQALGSATVGVHVVEFTVTDDAGNSSTANLNVDVTGNQAPTISVIADQTINMNADTGALAITVGDIEDAAGTLTLSATTDNPILIDAGTDFLFGGSGASRTLTVTPQSNNVGVATITVTVTDSATASTSTTFVLTVTDSTDAPSIAPIANITITRDQTSAVFNFTATDPQGDGTLGAPGADSANTVLIQPGDFTFGGAAPNLTFQITPQAGQTGTAVCTIFISDGTHTASRSFTVTVQDPSGNGGGGGDDDDEGCTTGSGSGMLMLLALLAALAVVTRVRRTA